MSSAFLSSAVAIAIAWAVALAFIRPLIRPQGKVASRTARGRQFAANTVALVFGVTSTRAITSGGDAERILAVFILSPLFGLTAFAAGYLVGPPTGSATPVADGYEPARQRQGEDTGDPPIRSLHRRLSGAPAYEANSLSDGEHQSPDAEALWSRALVELDSDQRRPGLWAKAFALSDGVDSQARAAYLRERVAELKAMAAAQHTDDVGSADLKPTSRPPDAAGREHELMPPSYSPKKLTQIFGVCPKCRSTLEIEAISCNSCGASATRDSGWQPDPIQ